MAFNRLVWGCTHQGTQIGENKTGLTIKPENDERVIFFKTDCDVCKAALNVALSTRMADALIFYRLAQDPPIIAIAEFKGSAFEHAVSQILSTLEAVKSRIPNYVTKPRFHAIIVSSAGAPKAQASLQKRLADRGMTLRIASGVKKFVDLRSHLPKKEVPSSAS
jgi:hypothetical protein